LWYESRRLRMAICSHSEGHRGALRQHALKKHLPIRNKSRSFWSFICTGARRNPATRGTNQGNRERRFDPTVRGALLFARILRWNSMWRGKEGKTCLLLKNVRTRNGSNQGQNLAVIVLIVLISRQSETWPASHSSNWSKSFAVRNRTAPIPS
jgi:hypothetical protein